MEISSVYAISSVASALASSPAGGAIGNWFYSKFKKWSLKKRLSGLLLLKGVSTICQKLSNTDVPGRLPHISLFAGQEVFFNLLPKIGSSLNIG